MNASADSILKEAVPAASKAESQRRAQAAAELAAARAWVRRGDPAAAAEAAKRALSLDPQLAEAEVIVAWAGWRSNDVATAEEAAERALALQPLTADAELILAWARSQHNDPAGAEASAKRALALNPKLARAELIVSWSRSQLHDPAGAEQAARRALALDPSLAEAELIVARCRYRANDPAAAEDAAQRALSLDPKSVAAASMAAQAATMAGDAERTIGYYRHLATLEPDSPRWPLKIVAALDLGGRIAEARRELEAVLERWPSNRLVQRFLELSWLGGPRIMESLQAAQNPNEPDEADHAEADAAVAAVRETEWRIADLRGLYNAAPKAADLVRPPVIDDTDADVLVAECVGAKSLVLVFTGTNDRMWLPLPLFDRYLAALGVSAVYLKDFRRLLFTAGVQSLGGDYTATLAALGRIKSGLGAKRLYTIGHSGGGRPAIRYGVELGAANAVSIAGATGPAPCLDPAAYPRDQLIQSRTSRYAPRDMLDLKPFLENRRFRSKITLVYGLDAAAERANAEYLSGIPGVALRPVAGPSPTIMSLAREGDFAHTLADLLGLAAPATPVGKRGGERRRS